MLFKLKRLFFIFTFNVSLFVMLMIGIQNSSIKKKVNLSIIETIRVPIGFLIGVSFISGSLTGSFLNISFGNKEKLD